MTVAQRPDLHPTRVLGEAVPQPRTNPSVRGGALGPLDGEQLEQYEPAATRSSTTCPPRRRWTSTCPNSDASVRTRSCARASASSWNLLHGSNGNLSPFTRSNIFIV